MATESFDRSVFAKPWLEFLDEFGESPALRGDLDEILRGWDSLLAKLAGKYEFPPPDDSVKTEQHDLGDYWVRSYEPPEATGQEPLGIYIHGGGWAMGSVDGEDAVARLISKQCKMKVVAVEYRLAPKHRYPTPLDDCVTAAEWALKHFGKDKVVFIGGSAGGNLAFAAALKMIDVGKGNQVGGVVALVPVTVLPDAVPEELKAQYTSYEEHANHTVNTKSAMETFIAAYGGPADDPYVSPLLHPRLSDLPKTYIAECSTDTLRDDARLMKQALEKADVELRYKAFEGYPHYSWTFPSKHLAGHQADFFTNLTGAIDWMHQSAASKL